MGLGLVQASLVAWWIADQVVYGAIRTAHPILGWRADRTRLMGPPAILREAQARPAPPTQDLISPVNYRFTISQPPIDQ